MRSMPKPWGHTRLACGLMAFLISFVCPVRPCANHVRVNELVGIKVSRKSGKDYGLAAIANFPRRPAAPVGLGKMTVANHLICFGSKLRYARAAITNQWKQGLPSGSTFISEILPAALTCGTAIVEQYQDCLREKPGNKVNQQVGRGREGADFSAYLSAAKVAPPSQRAN